jgi:phosphoglycerate dehydrogenase-like enzyme
VAPRRAAGTAGKAMGVEVVITPPFLPGTPAGRRLLAGIEAAGIEGRFAPPARGRRHAEADLLSLVGPADGLVVGSDPVTETILASATRLRVIGKFGAGLDNIDVEACRRRGIAVTSGPGANREAVAELVFGLFIALARGLPEAQRRVREGEFPLFIGTELHGKTLGVIGLGQIGRAVAIRGEAFGMNVLAHDCREDSAWPGEYATLEHVLRHADFVSIHVPLTPATRGLIGERQLGLMKPVAYLVNTARGEIVDHQALYSALRERRLAGAGLDVFWREPPDNHPLLHLPNVIATPHLGGFSHEALLRSAQALAADLVRALTQTAS